MYDPSVLEGKTPAELQARRAEILEAMRNLGVNDLKDAPTDLLQELAFIFTVMRRKNAGPPSAAKTSRRGEGKRSTTLDDVMDMLA